MARIETITMTMREVDRLKTIQAVIDGELTSVLGSAQAIAVNIEMTRASVRLREMIVSNEEMALRLNELENKADLMALKHDTFEHNTRVQLKQVFDAIRELMTPPETPIKRTIGFVTPDEKPGKPKALKVKNNRLAHSFLVAKKTTASG